MSNEFVKYMYVVVVGFICVTSDETDCFSFNNAFERTSGMATGVMQILKSICSFKMCCMYIHVPSLNSSLIPFKFFLVRFFEEGDRF